jgi:phage shock protein A
MIRAIRRQWKYFTAWIGGKQREHADPKVQLEQAIEEAQRQHQLLTQQASAVLANQHQLQIQLGRAIDDTEKLRGSAAQALRLADERRRAGESQKAEEYEQTARAFATQLASTEQSMESLKGLHDKALVAAEAARRAVQQNEMLLRDKMQEKSQLLTQLEQAKMQERMNAALATMESNLAALPGDTPTLDEVRAKIEARYARALGAAELQSSRVDVRMLEVQQSMLQAEGDKRLEEIRSSLRLEAPKVEILEPKGITDGSETKEATPVKSPARSRSRRKAPAEPQ